MLALENKALREFDGKCGDCEYAQACGGSRARAFAMAGSMFAPEPTCAYA